jgi:hypothetical protein
LSDNDISLHDRFVATLIAHVADDRYPSTSMMNQIEQVLTPRLYDTYVEVLLEKIADDEFPSPELVKRIAALVA